MVTGTRASSRRRPQASSRLTTACFARSSVNSDAFAAKYASIDPWWSRWSCERFVNTAASNRTPSDPALIERVRGDLHRDRRDAGVPHPREQSVEVGRLGRGSRDRHGLAGRRARRPCRSRRSGARRRGTPRRADGRRGLAVRAGDADDRHRARRLAEHDRRHRPHRPSHGAGRRIWGTSRSSHRSTTRAAAPARTASSREVVPIGGRPRHTEEQSAPGTTRRESNATSSTSDVAHHRGPRSRARRRRPRTAARGEGLSPPPSVPAAAASTSQAQEAGGERAADARAARPGSARRWITWRAISEKTGAAATPP